MTITSGTLATLADGTEDTTYTILASVLLQGFSEEGKTLTVSNLTTTHGTLTPIEGGWSLVPAANYYGDVTLNYEVVDGEGGVLPAIQHFNLLAVNDAPIANDDTLTAIKNTPITYTSAQLLANDTDVDNFNLFHTNIYHNHETGHDYFVSPNTHSWRDAQAEAVALGGNLVTINNVAEQTWLTTTFGSQANSSTLWIGYSDKDTEGSFQWASGETTSGYTNWASSEPNNYGGDEDYAQISGDGSWNDLGETTGHGLIELSSLPASIAIASVSNSVNGSSVLNTDGSVTFTPATDFEGAASFNYQLTDGFLSDTATVNVTVAPPSPNLINGLGGDAGFGENAHFRNDDYQTDLIDVTSAFASGIKFGGNTYNGLYINNNGMITFGTPFSGFVPNGLQLGVSSYDYVTGTTKLLPTIALHWTDLDTRYGIVSPSLGGTSMGTNLVYWDIDEINKNVTITWDDVGEYSTGSTPVLAGQIILHDAGAGNMDITFRYENASSLSSHTVTAGWNVGVANGVLGSDYYAIPNNTNSTSSHDVLADLDTRLGNTGKVGIWEFSLRDGGIYVSTGSTTVFTEQTPIVVDSAITISSAGIWNNGTLAVQITANATADDSLKLPTTNNGGIWLATDNVLMSGSTVIGSASATSVSNGTAWTFTFNNAATTELVQSTARAIIFGNNSDTPNPTQRTVTFTATDSISSPASSTQIVGVLKVNDAPTITLHGTQNYTQSGGGVLLDNSVQVHDAELDALNNYNGASITLARVGSASINDVFSSAYFSGSNVVITDGSTPVTIGSFTNSGGTLVVTFNANATSTLVTQLLQSIIYSNNTDASGNVSLNWTFSDGNTSEQGSGGVGNISGITVVSLTNNAPTVSSTYLNQGVAYGKEWTYDLQLASHFSDPENDTLTYSVTLPDEVALPSWLTFSNGFLTGTPPTRDFGTSYPIRVTATDLGNLSVSTEFNVTVLDFNAGNLFTGAEGNHSITATAGIDTISYETLSPSSFIVASLQTGIVSKGSTMDTLTSGATTDTLELFENIIGTNNNDTLTSGDNMANVNVLVGNLGDDHYIVQNTAVEIIERINSGNDSVDSSVSFTLPANVEQLTLLNSTNIDATGNNAGNILIGNSGNNRLDGRGNTDTMQGGVGDDTYVVDNKNDVVQENANGGTDTVLSSVTYKLLLSDGTSNNVENLTLTGRSAISGVGNSGNNIIIGNAGANWLKGGLGVDTLTGGVGADKFKFDSIADSLTSLPDMITDFKRAERDKIELSSIDANSTTTTVNEAFEWKGTAVLTANFAGKLRYVVSGSDSIIEGYVNDDSVADFKIQVIGVTDLSAADFGL